MTDRTLIVSATHLLARGFLFVPTDRRSPAGQPVNGLFAVARAVLHALDWKTPVRAVAVIDRRLTEWPELLVPQLALLEELLLHLGVPSVEAADEAHVVASYARAALQAGDDVVIVGADKRYAQLVTDTAWWYDANKDARYTPEIVRKRFGVGPERVADWLALVGDDDRVPGVAGIGAKGATALLTAHPDVESALREETTLENRVRKALKAAEPTLASHLANARLGARPLPLALAACVYRPETSSELNAHLTSLGFVELLKSVSVERDVTVCETADALAQGLRRLAVKAPSFCALLEEGTPPGLETLFGIAVSGGKGASLYVPAGTDAWPALLQWLADPEVPKQGHDVVATWVALRRAGSDLRGLVNDTACASHLTDPSGWAPHDLPRVARYVLGQSLPDDDEVLGTGAQRKTWRELGEKARAVAAERAHAIAEIAERLSPAIEPQLLHEYLALSETLVRMELNGAAVDVAQLDRAASAFADIERELEQEIEALAGHGFNINSSAQIGRVLFEELKLPIVSRTKTGYGTSNEALERIEHAHPIVARVLRWRTLRRLGDTWLRALRRCIHPDGRVRSRFYPARSFSGQIVSTQPDLTRVPGRTPEMAAIRRAFVAPPGRLLMSVDFSQLGLYVLAHLTRDPALVEPLRRRADMHRLTAAAILEKPIEAITDQERQVGKVVNFASFAGQGPSALGLQLGLTPAEAKAYLARFDRHYAGVRAFQDAQLEKAKADGFIVTLAGRRWPIGGLESLDSQLRSYAERMARRGTHEGSVADVARRALLRADQALRDAGLSATPLVEVVDEVLFEVAESELHATAKACAEAMRHAYELEVPLVVGVEAGKTWAELAPVPL